MVAVDVAWRVPYRVTEATDTGKLSQQMWRTLRTVSRESDADENRIHHVHRGTG